MDKNILIAGGTGLIGKALSKTLTYNGYNVSLLSRNPDKINDYSVFAWNPTNGFIDHNALKDQDVIINLAGISIASKYWSKKRKQEIQSSRINALRLLKKALLETKRQPEKIISASAVGYYGDRPDIKLDETAGAGEGFLAETCVRWEEAADRLSENTIKIRIGVVLSNKGGYLTNLMYILGKGVNVIPGRGTQHIPWIHINDLVQGIKHITEHNAPQKVYNLCSPYPVDISTMQSAILRHLKKNSLKIKIPALLLKYSLGSFSELFLNNQNVVPANLLKEGFGFKYNNLEAGLHDLME
jgi:uncharacterized protein (TIGR01777 family)